MLVVSGEIATFPRIPRQSATKYTCTYHFYSFFDAVHLPHITFASATPLAVPPQFSSLTLVNFLKSCRIRTLPVFSGLEYFDKTCSLRCHTACEGKHKVSEERNKKVSRGNSLCARSDIYYGGNTFPITIHCS